MAPTAELQIGDRPLFVYLLYKLWRYGIAVQEVLREEFTRSPEILIKMLRARRRHGFGPDIFLLFSLHNRPEETWGDYFPYNADQGRLLRAINRVQEHRMLTVDKLLATELLEQAGVAVPQVVAVVGRDAGDRPVPAGIPALNRLDAIEAFLRGPECPERLFSKPAGGESGAGAFVAIRSGAGWRMKGGAVLSPSDLAEKLLKESGGKSGRLIQACLENHPDIAALTGNSGLSTLRIITARTREGVRVVVAVQKLIGKEGATDTFTQGVTGNLLASVDLETGALGPCMGRKPGRQFVISEFVDHPFSGARVAGVRLPQWEEALDTVRRAARAFTHQPFLGFDLALTTQGPMILEANSMWSWTLPQTVNPRGGRSMLLETLPELDITEAERAEVLRLLDTFL